MYDSYCVVTIGKDFIIDNLITLQQKKCFTQRIFTALVTHLTNFWDTKFHFKPSIVSNIILNRFNVALYSTIIAVIYDEVCWQIQTSYINNQYCNCASDYSTGKTAVMTFRYLFVISYILYPINSKYHSTPWHNFSKYWAVPSVHI